MSSEWWDFDDNSTTNQESWSLVSSNTFVKNSVVDSSSLRPESGRCLSELCPLPHVGADDELSLPGWCLEILKMMADSLQLKIEKVVAKNAVGSLDWGTQVSGNNWKGVLGYLTNGTADTACLLYQKTALRDQYFDFSYPVTNVQPIYVVRRQIETIGSVLWNAFKPYSVVTWLVLLGSLLFQMLVMIGITKVETWLGRRKLFRPWEMVWQVFQLQLDEKSEEMQFYTISGNIVLFFFSLLQASFIIKLYEGGNANPFKDADGMIVLIGQGQYHLTTNYLGNWYFDNLRNSNASHYVSLRKATELNPVVLAASVDAALDLVETGKYIFPIQEDSIAMQMSKQRCNLVYVSAGLPQETAHLVFNNNSIFLRLFDHAIIMQQLFIQRTFSKYFLEGFKLQALPKCDTSQFDDNVLTKPLDISAVIGIFTLGGIGIAVSIVGFGVEWYIHVHKMVLSRRRRTRGAFSDAFGLLAVARVHLRASEGHFDLARLAEIRDRQNKIIEQHIEDAYD